MRTREAVTPESFETLGALLRHLRHRAQLTQRDLAIAIGYTEAHLSRIESNQRKVDRAVLTARFVPALDLHDEPQWVARLLELADDQPLPPAGTPDRQPPPAAVVPKLLATKLHVPTSRRQRVARPHLLRRLGDALSVPLTLVVAPAGFGKSTLLAEWLATLESATPPVAAAWLSLDADDNDVATFARYLVAAARRLAPDAGAETLALLASRPPVRTLLAPLLNDLAALPVDCVLVLDDGHLVDDPGVAEALTFLTERIPAQLHLVIAARAEPPLPLARLRARGQVLELRAADLRFDAAESAAFLRGTMQLPLSDAGVAALEARAEGWAAGLQLAALALREAADPDALVRAFAGSNRFVIDYLAEEVLDHLPVYLRHFLLQTAVLGRMCGPLCDAVLGVAGDGPADDSYSQVVLTELERRSLFLIPLDGERRWYRYHHLFAEVLHARLAAGTPPAKVAELHRRASRWFHQRALADEAIHHAVRSKDAGLTAELVEHYLAIGLSRNDERVWSWYGQVPPELVAGRPRLALQVVDLLSRVDRRDEALRLLDTAPALVNPPDAEIAAGAALMRARVLRMQLAEAEAKVWLQQAIATMPAGDGPLQAILAVERGLLDGFGERVDEGLQHLEDAFRRFRALGYDGDALFALASRLTILSWCGRLREALATSGAAARWVAEVDATLAPRAVNVMQARAGVLVEQNRLDEAGPELEQARRLAKGTLEWLPTMYLAWQRARATYARGDADGALAILEQAYEVYRERGGTWLATFVARFFAQAHLWRGAVAAAASAMDRSGPRLNVSIAVSPILPLVQVRIKIAQGRREPGGPFFDQAEELIERCLREIYPGQSNWILTAHMLAALLRHARGDVAGALERLERALELGEPEGFVRTFVDEGPPMVELLRAAQARGIRPAYCAHLLAAFPSGPAATAPAPA